MVRIWFPSIRRLLADVLAGPEYDRTFSAPRPVTDRGGATGTPSHDVDEAPPSIEQEENRVVSGGGVVGVDGQPPSHKARRSR